MKHSYRGFTFLEVTLFLAISVALFAGMAFGVVNSVAAQRFDSSANELADFLKNIYSQVSNPENTRVADDGVRPYCTLAAAVQNSAGTMASATPNNPNFPGRTNCAIYGKVVVFGDASGAIYVLDLIGNAVEYTLNSDSQVSYSNLSNSGITTTAALAAVRADYLALNSSRTIVSAGAYQAYTPNWDTKITDTNGNPFTGIIMIARSPLSGAISTYIHKLSGVPRISDLLNGDVTVGSSTIPSSTYTNLLSTYHFWPTETYSNRLSFVNSSADEVSFCLHPADAAVANMRKYFSIYDDGQGAASIDIHTGNEAQEACL